MPGSATAAMRWTEGRMVSHERAAFLGRRSIASMYRQWLPRINSTPMLSCVEALEWVS